MKETKVVYNICYGGFVLSRKAKARYLALKGAPFDYRVERHDPVLVKVVEELGEEANDRYSDLRVTSVTEPYRIDRYDGKETVHTYDDYDWINVE